MDCNEIKANYITQIITRQGDVVVETNNGDTNISLVVDNRGDSCAILILKEWACTAYYTHICEIFFNRYSLAIQLCNRKYE